MVDGALLVLWGNAWKFGADGPKKPRKSHSTTYCYSSMGRPLHFIHNAAILRLTAAIFPTNWSGGPEVHPIRIGKPVIYCRPDKRRGSLRPPRFRRNTTLPHCRHFQGKRPNKGKMRVRRNPSRRVRCMLRAPHLEQFMPTISSASGECARQFQIFATDR